MSARAWFRRSRWALLAVAVLVPVAVTVAFTDRFQPFLAGKDVRSLTAATGEPLEYAGSLFTLTGLDVVDGVDAGAPEGRDVVVATWHVEVVEPPSFGSCETAVVATVDGIDREWVAKQFLSLDLEFDDELEEFCRLSDPGAFDLLQTYLVPAGLIDDPVVEVSSLADRSMVLRFTE